MRNKYFNFRVNPEDIFYLRHICNLLKEKNLGRSHAIRLAIHLADQIISENKRGRIVLRSKDDSKQYGLYVGNGMALNGSDDIKEDIDINDGIHDEQSVSRRISVRWDETTDLLLKSLIKRSFGAGQTSVVRRSIYLCYKLLKSVNSDWKFGYINESNKFTEIDLDFSLSQKRQLDSRKNSSKQVSGGTRWHSGNKDIKPIDMERVVCV